MQEQELLSTRPHLPTSAMTLYQLLTTLAYTELASTSARQGHI